MITKVMITKGFIYSINFIPRAKFSYHSETLGPNQWHSMKVEIFLIRFEHEYQLRKQYLTLSKHNFSKVQVVK